MKITENKIFLTIALTLFLAAGCSPKIYRPPALGAEYQVDRGYPPEKHPQQLFGKKMEKDLTEKGVLRSASSPSEKSTSSTENKNPAKQPVAADSTTTAASKKKTDR